MTAEPIVLRPYGIWQKVDYVLPLGALGFAGYMALNTDYWSGFVIFISPFAIYGVVHLWSLIRRRANLTPARLEYCNGYWWRGIDRKDLRGYRTRSSRAGTWYRLVPKDPEAKPCTIPEWLFQHRDAKFWFNALTDLDALDVKEAEAALAADDAFGPDAETRRRNVKFVTRLTLGLAGAAVAASFAFEIGWAGRWVMVGVMLLPFVAAALNLSFPQQLRLAYENGKRDPRPSLIVLLIVPAFAILFIGIGDFNLEGGYRLLKLALPCALLAMIYVAIRVPDSRKSIAAVVGLVALPVAFFWGASAFVDVKFDDGPRQVYATRIEAMRVHSGRNTTYYLTLAPWSRLNLDPEVSVHRSFYEGVHIGDVVCVIEGRGVLGVGWFEVGDCDSSHLQERL